MERERERLRIHVKAGVIRQLYRDGLLTQAQRDALLGALREQGWTG